MLPSARAELLRWVSPVIDMRRTARHDTEIAGQPIRAGDKVVRYFGAANFDAREFADPYRLDLTRTPNPHIAFGAGAHVCLGQHIARIEIDALLHEVITYARHRIDAGAGLLPSNFISGRAGCRCRSHRARAG
jgi:cytochrome P450